MNIIIPAFLTSKELYSPVAMDTQINEQLFSHISGYIRV